MFLTSSVTAVNLGTRFLSFRRGTGVSGLSARPIGGITSDNRMQMVGSQNDLVILGSSPRLISTGQLHTLLCLHLRPINDIVYVEPYSIKDERSYLRGGFTLRCFQRLSRPDVATQLCRWHDNWCTSGLSIPVLSY